MDHTERTIVRYSARIGEIIKELAIQFKNGEITEEKLLSSAREATKKLINEVSACRVTHKNSMTIAGELEAAEAMALRLDLERLSFNDSIESSSNPTGSGQYQVRLVVMPDAVENFRKSLTSGKMHEEGWDEKLKIQSRYR
jgi:hypothetical protein